MNLGFHPYTLLFTYQIIASQLVYQEVEPSSKCSIVKNQIFPNRHFSGVILSNTLKRIKTHSDNATKENFVGYSEDFGEYNSYNPYPKNSFSCNVSSDKTSFDSFAAHPSQKLLSLRNRKAGSKTSFAWITATFVRKVISSFFTNRDIEWFQNWNNPFPRWWCFIWNFDAIENSVFSRPPSGEVINHPAYLDDYVHLMDGNDEKLTYREAWKTVLLINFCCEVCKISKSRRQPNREKWNKKSKIVLVFTDILGPTPTTSFGGNRNAIFYG